MTSRTFHLVAVALAAAGLILVCSDARATTGVNPGGLSDDQYACSF